MNFVSKLNTFGFALFFMVTPIAVTCAQSDPGGKKDDTSMQEAEAGQANKPNPFEVEMGQMGDYWDSRVKTAKSAFGSQIAHLKDLCELSDAVVKDLGKESEKFIDRWEESHPKMFNMIDAAIDEGGDQEEGEGVVDLTSPEFTHDPLKLIQDRRWHELLIKKLSPEQQKVYLSHREKRVEASSRLFHEAVVNELDRALLLSPDQLEKVESIVKEHLIEPLEIAMADSGTEMLGFMFSGMGGGGMVMGVGDVIVMGGMIPGPGSAEEDASAKEKLVFKNPEGGTVELDVKALNSSFKEVLGEKQFSFWNEKVWPPMQRDLSFRADRNK